MFHLTSIDGSIFGHFLLVNHGLLPLCLWLKHIFLTPTFNPDLLCRCCYSGIMLLPLSFLLPLETPLSLPLVKVTRTHLQKIAKNSLDIIFTPHHFRVNFMEKSSFGAVCKQEWHKCCKCLFTIGLL